MEGLREQQKGALNKIEQILICISCGKPEYYGEMRWLYGRCMCRDCYRADYEEKRQKIYKWDDLDGKRPTVKEYREQEDITE